MVLSDSIARFQARLGPNAPQLATGANTLLMHIVAAVLADGEDTRDFISAIQPNLFIASATGTALIAKAADYGVSYNAGSPATARVVFTSQNPLGQSLIIPTTTLVQTPGDAVVSFSQMFTTLQPINFAAGALSTASPQSETATVNGGPTGGTFTLTHNGQTTAALAYNASALAVQNALTALTNVGLNSVTNTANVSVTGAAGGPWIVTWAGSLSGITYTAMTSVSAMTGGTTPTVQVVLTTAVLGHLVAATTPGSAGNVAAGSISVIVTALTAGLSVSNALSAGGTAASGGIDPDSDSLMRSKVYAAIQPTYGTAAIENALLTVPGVYDVYVPTGGSGAFTYYWCETDGTQAAAGTTATATYTVTAGAITGVTLTNAGSGYTQTPLVSAPGGTGAIIQAQVDPAGSGTLTRLSINYGGSGYTAGSFTVTAPGIPTGVALAAANATPPGVTASSGTFTTVRIIGSGTGIAISYTCSQYIAAQTIEPQITAAVQTYMQGVPLTTGSLTVVPRSGLYHGVNQAPTTVGLYNVAQVATNYSLINLVITTVDYGSGALAPSALTTSPQTIYRVLALPSITYTRTTV